HLHPGSVWQDHQSPVRRPNLEVETRSGQIEEYDELDRKIDSFLSSIGAILRLLVILAILGALVYFILLPNLETWGPYLIFAVTLIFQLFFAIMFMIVQFVALFWFLGKPRIYWVMPGEKIGRAHV